MVGSMKRGDIFMAELNPVVGSEQGGRRPVLIIQNDLGNLHA
ncbi:MAG: type II toxin-antitoxin system PemK/MazF family toxin, partial [Clostridia bacterium]